MEESRPAQFPEQCVRARFRERGVIDRGIHFDDRNVFPQMRLDRREERGVCRRIVKRPVTVLLPLRAISVISAPGQPFHDAAADAALFAAIRAHLRQDIPLIELDAAINDPAFAEACATTLLAAIRAQA